MKGGLMAILLGIGLFFSSCEKEESFWEVDFNNDGLIEKFEERHDWSSGKKTCDLYCYSGNGENYYSAFPNGSYHLDYIPDNISFWDQNNDGYVDILLTKNTFDSTFTYWLKNTDGKFVDKEELVQAEKNLGR